MNVNELARVVAGLHAGADDIDGIGLSGAREVRRTGDVVDNFAVPGKPSVRSGLARAEDRDPISCYRKEAANRTRGPDPGLAAGTLQLRFGHLQDRGQSFANKLGQLCGNPAVEKLVKVGVVLAQAL